MSTPEPEAVKQLRRLTPWQYAGGFLAIALLGFVLDRLGNAGRVDNPADLDVRVHDWVVHHRDAWPRTTALLLTVTRFGNPAFAVPATLAVGAGLLALARYKVAGLRPSEAVVWLVTILGSFYLGLGLKEFFRRARPPVIDRLVAENSYSFPSGHSVFAGVFFAMLAVVLTRLIPPRRLGLRLGSFAACFAAALTIGASRVWLGVHYPTDVLGGLLLGSGWVYVVGLGRRAWSQWRAQRVDAA